MHSGTSQSIQEILIHEAGSYATNIKEVSVLTKLIRRIITALDEHCYGRCEHNRADSLVLGSAALCTERRHGTLHRMFILLGSVEFSAHHESYFDDRDGKSCCISRCASLLSVSEKCQDELAWRAWQRNDVGLPYHNVFTRTTPPTGDRVMHCRHCRHCFHCMIRRLDDYRFILRFISNALHCALFDPPWRSQRQDQHHVHHGPMLIRHARREILQAELTQLHFAYAMRSPALTTHWHSKDIISVCY